MEIAHEVLSFVLHLVAGLAIGFLAVIGAAVIVTAAVGGLSILVGAPIALFRVIRKKLAARYSTTEFSCTLALLVRVDETTARFSPSAQLRVEGALTRPWVRLELVDERGNERLTCSRPLPSTALDKEFPLPAFEPPDGASIEEVLGWRWDVVIADRRGERARWHERPRPAGFLNAEGELA